MATRQQFSVTLSKTGRDFGVWAGKTGGASSRDTSDYYPGAMRPARKVAGNATTSDLVIRKPEADLTDAAINALYADLQSDTRYTCVVQRLTAADRIVGAPRTYTCLVTGIDPPDVDSASSDEAEISVTLSVYGLPTIAA